MHGGGLEGLDEETDSSEKVGTTSTPNRFSAGKPPAPVPLDLPF